jgi:hypothetical protein
MCSDGEDFPIASDDDGHQASGAKAAIPKTSHYIFDDFRPPPSLMQFIHSCWISQFGEISPKKNVVWKISM